MEEETEKPADAIMGELNGVQIISVLASKEEGQRQNRAWL